MYLASTGATLNNCGFYLNVARGIPEAAGGGLLLAHDSDTRISSTFFAMNDATNGGGIALHDSTSNLLDVWVLLNTADYGAAAWDWDDVRGGPRFFGAQVLQNHSSISGGGFAGVRATPVFVNSYFSSNDAGASGGGMHLVDSSPRIINSNLVNNVAASAPEILNAASSSGSGVTPSVTVANSIIFNRTFSSPAVVNDGATLNATFCLLSDEGDDPRFNDIPLLRTRTELGSSASTLNVAGASGHFAVGDIITVGEDGVGRTVTATLDTAITLSPALNSPPALHTVVDNWGPSAVFITQDASLRADSPCIDAGDNSAVFPDLADLDGDGDVTEPVPVLGRFGEPRFADDPTVIDRGRGTAPIVDIGAWERPAP
jgi:hypothetical protein